MPLSKLMPDPTAPELLSHAEAALARRDYAKVHALCLKALEADSGSGRAYALLGTIAAAHAHHVKALELLDCAIGLSPTDPRSLAQKGRSLLALNRHDEALAAASAAAMLKPTDALTLDTIGVIFSRTGRHQDAVQFFERAIRAGAKPANVFYNLGAARQFLGQFDEAADAYREAIKRNPDMHKALSALVQLKKQSPDDNLIPALETLFAKSGQEPDCALHVGHALAKTYEDLGEPLAAFDWLLKAKAPKLRTLGNFEARDAAAFDAAKRTADIPLSSTNTDSPIFIVGLPRTGTTLIDRILSSHPGVQSAGELTTFSLLVKRQTRTPSPLVLDAETLDAAGSLDFSALGQDYMRLARSRISAPRFTDKMPFNFFYAALILKALPNARIICLRRHPLDSILSNFRQLFATSFTYYNYAYSLETAARFYVRFHALIAHWRANLPADRFIEVSYEDVVQELEPNARRLCAFAGLDFDPACLAFHENAAPVATASSVQVRQPLYASSIGRWRRYKGRLADTAKILFEAGLLSADDDSEACAQ